MCVGLCAVPASLFDLHRDPGRGSRFTDEAEGWREPRARAQSQLAVGHLRVHTHPPRFPRRDACSSAPLPCISFYLEEVRGVVPKRGKSQTLCHRLAGAPRTGRRGLGALATSSAASAGRGCGRQAVTQLTLPLQSVHTKPRFSQAQMSGVDARVCALCTYVTLPAWTSSR